MVCLPTPHTLAPHAQAHLTTTAHSFDIFGLATSSSFLITVAGDSSVKLWELATPKHPLAHVFSGVHRLGAHHVASSNAAAEPLAATAGFAGEIIIWDLENLKERMRITGMFVLSNNVGQILT